MKSMFNESIPKQKRKKKKNPFKKQRTINAGKSYLVMFIG